MATTRREYLQALDKHQRPIEAAFLSAVMMAVRRASIAEVEAGVAAYSVDRVLMSAALSSAVLSLTMEAIRTAYIAGGTMEAPVARIVFDIRNPRAEAWLADHSSDLVTRIDNAQRGAVRLALEAGMELGRNPRQTALDIVGRVGATGRRSGGILGLTDQQAQFVVNARRELLSGEPEQMANYFTRTRREQRFDGVVRTAMQESRPVKAADIDRITSRYSDRLLQTRGNNIARTESLSALSAGREQALQQAIREGVVEQQFVTREWDDTGDGRTRDSHRAMGGQKRGAGEPFQSPTGALMMHPGDTSLGAGAEDVINCRCHEKIKIDFIGQAAARIRNESLFSFS